MEVVPQPMPRLFQWLVIALLTLTLGVALATPGPGIDFSKDESLSTTLVLQKKVSDDEAGTGAVDAADSLGDLLAAIVERLGNRTSASVTAETSVLSAAMPAVSLDSISPRAPPRA